MNYTEDENSIRIEENEDELLDDFSDDSLFNIASYGADLSFREIITMYEEDELVKPELQRKYVWNKEEASRFIESILMGLPIPSLFFAQQKSQKLIVDGYQRIMTVYDYMNGIFSGDGKIFKLSNSKRINQRWRGKAFKELSTDEQRAIKSKTIHTIIFEQKQPKNDNGMYQIFERINTSGQTLKPQEIRNCIYQGTFNKVLLKMNDNKEWRKLFGYENADIRMRDVEFILRFFTLKSEEVLNSKVMQISLKKELNSFMANNVNIERNIEKRFEEEFSSTINIVYDKLGKNAFNNYLNGSFTDKFSPTIFDAVSIGFYIAKHTKAEIPTISNATHVALLSDDDFIKYTTTRTTNLAHIRGRIGKVLKIFFGMEL